jgi:hypothetical protein
VGCAVARNRKFGQTLHDPPAAAVDYFAPFSGPFFAELSAESRRRRSKWRLT